MTAPDMIIRPEVQLFASLPWNAKSLTDALRSSTGWAGRTGSASDGSINPNSVQFRPQLRKRKRILSQSIQATITKCHWLGGLRAAEIYSHSGRGSAYQLVFPDLELRRRHIVTQHLLGYFKEQSARTCWESDLSTPVVPLSFLLLKCSLCVL